MSSVADDSRKGCGIISTGGLKQIATSRTLSAGAGIGFDGYLDRKLDEFQISHYPSPSAQTASAASRLRDSLRRF
jgi:hypothetical protein